MRTFLTPAIVLAVFLAGLSSPQGNESLAPESFAIETNHSPTAAPPIHGQVTFLYFNDLRAADAFYSKILGRSASLDLDWVKIYPLSATASVGLVDGARGALRPSPTKPVMLSLVVEESEQVEQWYTRLKSQGVKISKEPFTNELTSDQSVRAFMFEDPEGYILEVFAWVKRGH